ncbi:MAG: coagulation factor 5/8 type domain protein [Segetibacter sp.]|nr:coagulation factor 5/8 type domain protein [Segetibacter sp.]
MRTFVSALAAVLLSATTLAQTRTAKTNNNLYKEFQSPGNAAQPRVWWHWMNGNITKDGISKDLEWMKRVGIGGFQNFDASLFTPVVVPKKLVFMTPDWKDAFKFTTELADKLGLEMAIAGSPGWSVTGGPWVEPQDAMKKYVWTETRVAGGQVFNGKLSQPAFTTGRFQNVELPKTTMLGESPGILPTYFSDVAVIACRLPNTDKHFTELKPKLTTSGGSFNVKDLTDGDLNNGAFLPPVKVDEDMWIQYEFETPETFKAVSITGAIHLAMEDFNGGPLNRILKVSDDGVDFKEVVAVSGSIVPQNTVSFPATTAKLWRMTYKTLPPPVNPFAAMLGGNPVAEKSDGVNVAEFVLHTSDRIDQFEDKAGFTPWKEDTKSFMPQNADAIPEGGVIDLTSKMQPDGSLNWTVPEGNWTVIRLGYSLTGRQNHPASPEATGLEVDKLDKEAVRKYINTYLDMYKDATGGMMGTKGLQYMILDSYEAGHMTWTKTFPAEFKIRRGYDILTWLPVLTGRVVQSIESSEKFLWDFRKTIGELIAESHYDVIGEELHKRGMKRYTESHENKRIYLADGMDVKRNADIPMSAMWTPGSLAGGADEEPRSEADIRESASVANIYGKPFVAAESMTSVGNGFSFHPEKLKRTADLEMASGLNRFVIHTSVHQPLDDKKPGFSLGPFGQYLTRQETWAEQSKAWMAYLGRSCYMLQQGKNVADILYFYGENNNITSVCETKLPAIPQGFEFDFVNASALLNAIHAKDGKLVAQSGNTYRVLMLDESSRLMTLPVLKKIKVLADAGVKVVGTKPERSPGMLDNDAEFQKIANDIWKNPNVTSFEAVNLKPDVIIKNAGNKILFRHRKSEADIYWLDNRSESPTTAEVSFKIAGKVPELWHPQTGKKEKVSYQIKDGRTIIPLKFESWDAYFIVFKENTTINAYTKPATTEKPIVSIEGPWMVNFQEGRGAPQSAKFEKLASWTENTDAGVRYFSGTGSYTKTITADKNWFTRGSKLWIDLGAVSNVAEVMVNGISLGIIWKKPFRIDATSALKPGNNTIAVKVTNLWVNRLIGDAQPGVTNRITYTTMPFYQAASPLLPSGLLGPVKIISTNN